MNHSVFAILCLSATQKTLNLLAFEVFAHFAGDLLVHSQILSGHYVAQLRMVFRPASNAKQKQPSPYYAFVQPFQPAPSTVRMQADGTRAHVTDDNIEMFHVCRCYTGNRRRVGRIVRLTDIWRPIELIPVFGKAMPADLEHFECRRKRQGVLCQLFFRQTDLPMCLLDVCVHSLHCIHTN